MALVGVASMKMPQRSLKKNTVYNTIKTVSAIIFPLITFPYISRILLPENIGKINFGSSIVSYFSLIASLGISVYAIRECSSVRDDKEKLSETASQIFSINIITTIIAYVMLGITLLMSSKLADYKSLIVIQSMSILASTLGADWLNSAMEDFRYITLRTVMFQFVSLALMFAFVHKSEDYMLYAIISLISSTGASVMNIWYRRRYCRVRFVKDIRWKRHLTSIIFLFVMLLAQDIFSNVDITMLGAIHGDREVGIYATAYKMANIIAVSLSSIVWVLMPRVSYYFAVGKLDEIRRLLNKTLNIYNTISTPCMLGLFLLSDDIINIIAGNSFSDSAGVLRILSIAHLFNFYGAAFWGNIVLLSSKRESAYTLICCASALMNVVTNFLLIPIFGAKGAAFTTCLCYAMMLIWLVYLTDKRIRVRATSKSLFSPLCGYLGICVVCIFSRQMASQWVRVIFSIIASIIVYFAIQIAYKNALIMEFLEKGMQKFGRPQK